MAKSKRINQILKVVFAKIFIKNPKKWYKYLRRVQHALNGTFQRSVRTTPYQLMFGVKLRSPEDLQIIELLEQAKEEELQSSRNELRQSATEALDKIQKENERNYNKKRQPATKYNIGDIVAIKRTQLGPGLKLAIKFLGPYKVTAGPFKAIGIDDNDRYEVQKIDIDDEQDDEGPNKTTTGADFMKPWRGFRDDLETSDDSNDEDEQSDENLEIADNTAEDALRMETRAQRARRINHE